MTSLVEPFNGETDSINEDANHNIRHRHCNNVLKLRSKENILKLKCKRDLKRKLKKYKLRRDGIEDQDVIDVSDTLLSSLYIRSPNKGKHSVELESEEIRPKNYLIRMVRRKQTTLTATLSQSSDVEVKVVNQNDVIQISPSTMEEKRQTNAFKLLMESRNKSLGGNSPGKEKPIDEVEMQEIVEKKKIKAKRNLMLQKMAEGKGALKRKDMEEQEESIIKKKMEKRAERLKNMIWNKEPKTAKEDKQEKEPSSCKIEDKMKKETTCKVRSPLENIEITEINGKVTEKPVKTLQLVNMFSETIGNNISSEKKHILKEDEDFLKKLSPSLRKKDMLSYFKKVEKDSDSVLAGSVNDNAVIKVKLTTKGKKRGRKKKLSIRRDRLSSCEIPENEIQFIEIDESMIEKTIEIVQESSSSIAIETLIKESDDTVSEKSKERKKRKCDRKEIHPSDETSEIESIEIDESIVKNTIEILQVSSKSIAFEMLKKQSEDETSEKNKVRRKRKRDRKESHTLDNTASTPNLSEDARPKRIVKKPIKYNDDVCISSSDEELHIFTPKKKQHLELKNQSVKKATLGQSTDNLKNNLPDTPRSVKKSALDKSEKISKSVKEKKILKQVPTKPVKLAPIFTKSQPDAAAIEAKQKFLQSGVPDQLKKLMIKQTDINTVSNHFQIVVHVQQLNSVNLPALPKQKFADQELDEQISLVKFENDLYAEILDLSTSQNVTSAFKNINSTQMLLQSLKETYPRFPVYRTYRLLRGKKKGEYKDSHIYSNLDNSVEILNCSIDMQNDNPDQLTWTDKYKPLKGNEIIGNFEMIKELRKWLVTWTENEKKSKGTNSNGSDSSDYYQSEPDSRDSMKSNNNLLILSGPIGSGKTSSVYAVAAELSIKVIEVNASSKRTGKIMLQDLQEATQSHKVNRGTSGAENSQKSQEIVEVVPAHTVKFKKRGRPRKVVEQPMQKKAISKEKADITNGLSASQESTRTAMSLILIDDADIVFDQDDGFCSAIMQLIHSSKRPVILITGSLSCLHLQRFVQSSKILKLQPLLPNMLGTWLDIMCLADSGTCWPGAGAKLLNFFKRDIRKTINCLQFYVCSQDLSTEGLSQADSQNTECMEHADDETSNISWADRDSIEDRKANDETLHSQWLWNSLLDGQVHLKYLKHPFEMFDIWWSIPKLLNVSDSNCKVRPIELTNEVEGNKIDIGKSLESMCNALESISVCDYLSHMRPDTKPNITSHPWYYTECDSVSELESSDKYDRNHELSSEISYELVKRTLIRSQEKIKLENRYNLEFPGISEKRQRDRIISRHISLTSYLNPLSLLDRKALALDYWSSCRAICRIEKSKTDSSSKRNNRFCHYLKSLNVLCKNDSYDRLVNSLNCNSTENL